MRGWGEGEAVDSPGEGGEGGGEGEGEEDEGVMVVRVEMPHWSDGMMECGGTAREIRVFDALALLRKKIRKEKIVKLESS